MNREGGQRRTRSVAFDSTDLTLKGTLELPSRATPEDPVPAAVFVHGSGPHNRNEPIRAQLAMTFPEEVTVFADLAEALAEAGYASLRYDKRTCGPFNGCADNGYPVPARETSVTDFIDDAIAAIDFLSGIPEVDLERIVYIGHSQGGTLAFEALARRPSLAGAILLAGNRRSIEKLLAWQAERLREVLEELGTSQEKIDARGRPDRGTWRAAREAAERQL